MIKFITVSNLIFSRTDRGNTPVPLSLRQSPVPRDPRMLARLCPCIRFPHSLPGRRPRDAAGRTPAVREHLTAESSRHLRKIPVYGVTIINLRY